MGAGPATNPSGMPRRLREWLAAMQERESVKATMRDDAYHIAAYSRYADASADGTTAIDMRL